jgi:cyclopropane fatty-acyl-phospholipid synthase-like methyltransferase
MRQWGTFARYLIERGYDVTGVDAVEEMLDMCRARFPRMRWLRADMRQIDIGARFDIVIAWDSYFHLPPSDQRRMLDTFSRHTAAGGVLMFTSGPEGKWRRPLRRRAYHAVRIPRSTRVC